MKNFRRGLFLCTGNSCRSQMAEALVNARFPAWQAFSAGVRPSGYVHPMAIRVLRELGIEHRGESKSADRFRDQAFDLVITVCDEANEECPVWLVKGTRRHESFGDPAKAQGTDEERLVVFRLVRDEIAAALPRLLR
ncbi:MAG: arsenate reductase ArsC [Chloroflexota bacterium]